MDSLKDSFIPVHAILPSEFRRKIFLQEFVKYAYTPVEDSEYTPSYSLPMKYKLDHIFRSYPFELEELDVVTIASFISYLGTNGGRCLLDTFQKYSESKFFRDKEEAFVHAWLSENSRQFGINNNYRTIEFILAPPSKFDFHRGLVSFSMDSIKTSQYEVIELIVKWLSTSEGVAYILNCLDLIEQEKDKTHEIRKMAR